MSKAKVGGRNKVVQKAANRTFRVVEVGSVFECLCATTGRKIASGFTEHDARKRAGKRGWVEYS